jgi:hypothetical protein
MRTWQLTGLATLALAASGLALPARAQTVDLQLVLAVDISRSMDANEQRVQRQGYVAAFRDPDVIKAITSGPYGKIAVTYVEWSSSYYQQTLVPWAVIGSDEDALVFSDQLAKAPINVDSRTSISGGLLYAAGAFTKSGVTSDRRSIDVSGDGPNNDGQAVAPVRDQLVHQGITINGLPILIDPTPVYAPGPVSLADYYMGCVIGGPNAFVIAIHDLSQFADAIRRKLILEIASADTSVFAAANSQPSAAVDCSLAEAFGPGRGFSP